MSGRTPLGLFSIALLSEWCHHWYSRDLPALCTVMGTDGTQQSWDGRDLQRRRTTSPHKRTGRSRIIQRAIYCDVRPKNRPDGFGRHVRGDRGAYVSTLRARQAEHLFWPRRPCLVRTHFGRFKQFACSRCGCTTMVGAFLRFRGTMGQRTRYSRRCCTKFGHGTHLGWEWRRDQ